jgi:hypothetical protein
LWPESQQGHFDPGGHPIGTLQTNSSDCYTFNPCWTTIFRSSKSGDIDLIASTCSGFGVWHLIYTLVWCSAGWRCLVLRIEIVHRTLHTHSFGTYTHILVNSDSL